VGEYRMSQTKQIMLHLIGLSTEPRRMFQKAERGAGLEGVHAIVFPELIVNTTLYYPNKEIVRFKFIYTACTLTI
jgi:hypothetical protein